MVELLVAKIAPPLPPPIKAPALLPKKLQLAQSKRDDYAM
jgi:hypothetical protein